MDYFCLIPDPFATLMMLLAIGGGVGWAVKTRRITELSLIAAALYGFANYPPFVGAPVGVEHVVAYYVATLVLGVVVGSAGRRMYEEYKALRVAVAQLQAAIESLRAEIQRQ